MQTLFERGRGESEQVSVSTLETTASDELPTTEETASGRGAPGRGEDRPAAEDESVLPDDDEDDGGAASAPPPVPAPAPARKQVPASAMPAAEAAQPAKRKDAVFTAVASVLAAIAVVACGVRGWQVRQDRIAATAKAAAEEAEKQRLAEEAERQRKAAEEAEKQRLAEEAERQRKAAEEAEKQRLAEEARKAEEARRKAEEAERQRIADEARRKAAEEAERQRKTAEEAEKQRLAEEARRKAEAARREAETALANAQETFAGKSADLIARINQAGEAGPYEAERDGIVAEFAGSLADAAGILPDDNTKLVRAKGVMEEEKGKIGGALGKLGERLREAQARAQGEAEEREREAEARAQDEAASLFPFAEGECPSIEVLEKWREDYGNSFGRWVPFDTLEFRYTHLTNFAANGKTELFFRDAKIFKDLVGKALGEKEINEAWLGKEQASRTFGSMFGDVLAGWEEASQEAGDAQAAAVAERCRRAYRACTATAGREAEDKSIALAKALAAMAELVESHWPLLNGWLQEHESGFVENSAKRWSNDFLNNPGGAVSGKWLSVVSNAVRNVLTAAGGAD
ncbi:MAG: cell envelope integrity protein TolA [Kiritimatiellae bacterium]|nr:cell envelope integrity protein TolA [Kiritimatiellia bacterium]